MSNRNALDFPRRKVLEELVVAEYLSSHLSDVDFAKLATERLGFLVSDGNVAGLRKTNNITSPIQRKREENKARAAIQQAMQPIVGDPERLGQFLRMQHRLNALIEMLRIDPATLDAHGA